MYQKWLLNKYVIGGAAIAIALTYHIWKVGSLESELADMTNKYTTLSTVTQIQNEEIVRWQALGKQYGELLADAAKKNAEENKRWAGLLDKLRNDKIPVDCDGAVAHLKQRTNEIAKEWNKK